MSSLDNHGIPTAHVASTGHFEKQCRLTIAVTFGGLVVKTCAQNL